MAFTSLIGGLIRGQLYRAAGSTALFRLLTGQPIFPGFGGGADVRISVSGFREALRALDQTREAVDSTRGLAWAVSEVGREMQAHARAITHIDTGALAASHRMITGGGGATARALIFIDPTALNPRGQRPAEYGLIEHARGGSHAFYARTYDFFTSGGGARIIRHIRNQLP